MRAPSSSFDPSFLSTVVKAMVRYYAKEYGQDCRFLCCSGALDFFTRYSILPAGLVAALGSTAGAGSLILNALKDHLKLEGTGRALLSTNPLTETRDGAIDSTIVLVPLLFCTLIWHLLMRCLSDSDLRGLRGGLSGSRQRTTITTWDGERIETRTRTHLKLLPIYFILLIGYLVASHVLCTYRMTQGMDSDTQNIRLRASALTMGVGAVTGLLSLGVFGKTAFEIHRCCVQRQSEPGNEEERAPFVRAAADIAMA